jgi:hypothetical protein
MTFMTVLFVKKGAENYLQAKLTEPPRFYRKLAKISLRPEAAKLFGMPTD